MVALDRVIILSICNAVAAHFGTAQEPWTLDVTRNDEEEKNLQNDRESARRKIFQWIHSNRFSIMLAVLVLFLAVALRNDVPNHYETLDVPIGSPKHAIQRQYAKLKQQFNSVRVTHDTKVTDYREEYRQESQRKEWDNFLMNFQLAYETLANDTTRIAYERFGDISEKGSLPNGTSLEISVITLAVAFQLLCFIIGYFATIPKQFHQARMLFLLFNVAVFCLELHLRFLDSTPSNLNFWPFNGLLAFEKIEFCKRLFPSVLGMSLIFSDYLFSDESAAILKLLHAVVLTNRFVCQQITELTNQTPERKDPMRQDDAALVKTETSQATTVEGSLQDDALVKSETSKATTVEGCDVSCGEDSTHNQTITK